jgi:hypothetical protein
VGFLAPIGVPRIAEFEKGVNLTHLLFYFFCLTYIPHLWQDECEEMTKRPKMRCHSDNFGAGAALLGREFGGWVDRPEGVKEGQTMKGN